MPGWLNPVIHLVQGCAILGGTVAMVVTGHLPVDTAVGVLAGTTGLWAGVGSTLLASGKSAAASTPKAGTAPAPVASPPPTAPTA